METLKCIKERKSIRKFSDKEISKETLEEIVEAASFAPSWKNTQITRYNVILDPAKKAEVANDGVMGFSYNTNTINGAKALVVVSYVNGRCGYERDGSFTTSKGDRWQMFDAGIATQTFSLAAWEKGVGSVILGIFDEEAVAKIIGLPETETVAALVAIGYPDEEPQAPKRKGVEDLLRVL